MTAVIPILSRAVAAAAAMVQSDSRIPQTQSPLLYIESSGQSGKQSVMNRLVDSSWGSLRYFPWTGHSMSLDDGTEPYNSEY